MDKMNGLADLCPAERHWQWDTAPPKVKNTFQVPKSKTDIRLLHSFPWPSGCGTGFPSQASSANIPKAFKTAVECRAWPMQLLLRKLHLTQAFNNLKKGKSTVSTLLP